MKSRFTFLWAVFTPLVLALCFVILLPACAQTTQKAANPEQIVRVAAAADLRPVLPIFAQMYRQQTGVKLEVSFSSSSTLATQIINGAPFDLFLAADFTFPEKVVAANLAAEPEPVPYAKGALVLWVPKNSPLQPPTMEKLLDPAITRIAVADEVRAPYGRAAYAAMRSMKVFEQLKPKLVVAEDISQTAQFVQSGNAQAGFISLTLANSAPLRAAGNFARVPNVYPDIRQCAVVVKGSAHQKQAQAFLSWIISPYVQENLPKFGLDPIR